jgi:copper resistance protein D
MLEALAAATQALLYAGVLCASGAVFAAITLNSRADASGRHMSVLRFGALATIVASAGGTLLLLLRLGIQLDADIVSAVLATNVGAAAALRIGGAMLLLILPATHDDSFGRGMHLSAAVLIIASFAYSGHAATEGMGAGVIAALHVAIAAWWIGSLIEMVRERDDVTRLVRRFSSLALGLVAGLVVAGVVLIVLLLDFSSFAITPYVRNLGIKIVVALGVFAIAAYNKFALTNRVLAGDAAATITLRRAIHIELALIAVVLLATAVLTTYSSPFATSE